MFERNIKTMDFCQMVDFNLKNKEIILGNNEIGSEYSLFFNKNETMITIPVNGDSKIDKVNIIKEIPLVDKLNKKLINTKKINKKNNPKLYKEIHSINAKFKNDLNEIIGLLRWHFNLECSHNYLKSTSLYINNNNKFEKISIEEEITFYYKGNITRSYDSLSNVNKLIEKKVKEPIAHEIYREAKENIKDNPRIAVIMGVAAIEIGLKNSIIELQPQTEWLLKKIQSPPVINMIMQYLPDVPVKSENKYKLSKQNRTLIEKYIKIRNKLIHTANYEINKNELKKFIELVHDFLYLLDYYKGFKITFDNLNPDFIKTLTKID